MYDTNGNLMMDSNLINASDSFRIASMLCKGLRPFLNFKTLLQEEAALSPYELERARFEKRDARIRKLEGKVQYSCEIDECPAAFYSARGLRQHRHRDHVNSILYLPFAPRTVDDIPHSHQELVFV